MRTTRATLPLALVALAFPALADPGFHDARLVLGFPGATSGAAYMVIHNHGGPDDRLLSAASPAAASAMLHESAEGEGGVMTMSPVDGLDLPADGAIEMAPGGLHVMLMGLAPLEPGATVPLTLTFASGDVTLDLPVELVGQEGSAQDGMEHMDHGG